MTRPILRDGGLVTVDPDRTAVADVPVHAVSLPDNHVPMDADRVKAYADLLRRGHALPPVLVHIDQETGRSWLIEGRHRFVAHVVVGRDTLTALCTPTLLLVQPGEGA